MAQADFSQTQKKKYKNKGPGIMGDLGTQIWALVRSLKIFSDPKQPFRAFA